MYQVVGSEASATEAFNGNGAQFQCKTQHFGDLLTKDDHQGEKYLWLWSGVGCLT